MVEKKQESKESKEIEIKEEKFSMPKNPWQTATIIFGVIVIVFVVIAFRGGITGGVVGKTTAAEKLVDYLNTKTGGGITLVSSENAGSLYKVIVSYKGDEVPVQYITKDGKYFVQGVIPISEEDVDTEPQEEIPKSDKPKVELFVMSHCPYGVKAQEILIPVMKLLGNKADIKTRFVYYAMHGKQEIDDNNIEYCIQKDQESEYIDYLTCFVGSEDSKECIKTAKIDETKLNSCINAIDKQFKITELYNDKSTWLSGNYPLYPVEKDLNEKYDVGGSESLLINGVQISPSQYRWDSNKLKEIVCSAFNTKPSECSQTLTSSDNSAPSSGSCS